MIILNWLVEKVNHILQFLKEDKKESIVKYRRNGTPYVDPNELLKARTEDLIGKSEK